MALGLFFVGLLLVVSAIKGTHSQLSSLLASEFTGAGNFWLFIVGIIFLGALGNIPGMRNTSRALIALVLVVLVLSNGGFWQQLSNAVQSPQSIKAPAPTPVTAAVDVKDAGSEIGKEVASSAAGLAAASIVTVGGGGAVGGAVGGIVSGIIKSIF